MTNADNPETEFTKFKLLDLFSGIGGFSLGLERSGGFETVAFCEIDPFCRKVLAKHWPKVRCYDDVRTLTATRLASDGIAINAICGGWPCQGISVAGKQLGIHMDDRSSLVWEVVRLVAEIRPEVVTLENVGAFIGSSTMADEYTVRCVCGWANRWRGMPFADRADEQRLRSQKFFLSAFSRNGGQGKSTSHEMSKEARRHHPAPPLAQSEPSTLDGLEYAYEGCASIAGGDVAPHDRQARAMPPSDQRVQADHQQALELRAGLINYQGADARAEQAWSADGDYAWMDCPSCGRELGQPSIGFARADGAGDVFRALAALGYHAEWDHIRASDLGANHARERVWIAAHPERGDAQELGLFKSSMREACLKASDRPLHGGDFGMGWPIESRILRSLDGVSNGSHRLKSLGNAVVPQIPELIGRAIMESVR